MDQSRHLFLIAAFFVAAASTASAQPTPRAPATVTDTAKGKLDTAQVLREATVLAHPPTIRSGAEKKVFTVNQSLVSVGGSAADLLQNVPTLQLDGSGNLSIRGATDLVVLVDGKRSLIGGGTITQLLQSIPASS